jgi:predicted RNA-binding protein YlqC (UPF0109 family)
MGRSRKSGKKSDSILHRDIKELEIGKSLRRLGNVRVTEWELSDVLPAVSRLANKEVDIVGAIKRTANYRVTKWELKDILRKRRDREAPTPEALCDLEERLRKFVGFVATRLIDEPTAAVIKTTRTSATSLRIKLVLEARDASALIGHGGHTAAAIRAIVKDVARRQHVRVILQILTHAEELAANKDVSSQADV